MRSSDWPPLAAALLQRLLPSCAFGAGPVVCAVSGGSVVMTVEPSWFGVDSEISTVWSHAASSTRPMPFVDGQMRPLISFTCHSWWDAPSWLPASTTICAASSGLSRA